MPLLGEPGHAGMVDFLQQMAGQLARPEAIVVISAHWEEAVPTVVSTDSPHLIYDYYGFPPESYDIRYPAQGEPVLAQECASLLQAAGWSARQDSERGLDHGVFVPLKVMYPEADILVTQVSLLSNLDARAHVDLGMALAPLRSRNVLVLGSGMSYHNLGVLLRGRASQPVDADRLFDDWLLETCCGERPDADRRARLADWQQAPGARACHPREEHLLPLMVCAGVARGDAAQRVFSAPLMGRRVSAFLWQ